MGTLPRGGEKQTQTGGKQPGKIERMCETMALEAVENLVGKIGASVLNALYTKAEELNFTTADSMDEARKNSSAAPSSDSGSVLLVN
jgi:hypothetical protein